MLLRGLAPFCRTLSPSQFMRALSSMVASELSEEQRAIVEMAQAFSRDKLEPHSAEWDRNSHFPVNVLKEAAELGLAGLFCSEEYGGAGM